ncbi:MAG: hypothetical protein H7838_07645 [Magnetococcus sp. DMHC-8]
MGQRVSKEVMELLAEMCEAVTPRTGGEKISDFFPKEGAAAIQLGALRQGPMQTWVPDRYSDDLHYVEPEFDAATGEHRYFSLGARGWATVPKEDMMSWDLDMDWLFGWISDQFGLPVQTKPKVLVPDVLWHVGNPWIGKRRCGLFFARRMGFNPGFDQVVDALRDRTGEPPGVLLTTSRWSVRNVAFPGNHQVMRLQDFLLDSKEMTSIDTDAVARLITRIRGRRRNLPFDYSNNYSTVTVNERIFVFRGDTQQQAVGALVEAYEWGHEKIRTDSMLFMIGSKAGQLMRLFKGHPDWTDLIGYGGGFCWLKV